MKDLIKFSLFIIIVFTVLASSNSALAAYHFSDFRAKLPIHFYGGASKKPVGLTPDEIKKVYNLPKTGGRGTIAIIGAYDSPNIEKDLNDFSRKFSLPAARFEKHKMAAKMRTESHWEMETALDAEWAHAIAPNAKILLVEAATPSGANLLRAIDYAAKRKDAVAVSISWGGPEFPEEIYSDIHFISQSGAVFFAADGDSGYGVSWPAASPNVVAVGGTALKFKKGKGGERIFSKELAWSGSGGGVSDYEPAPDFQIDYNIPKSRGRRAVPDVAYNASPSSGFSVIHNGIWRVVGGTSAGAPQWAAIAALGAGASNKNFYADKASENSGQYFRDIRSGRNGDCGFYCKARKNYNYITGLGVPLTVHF